MLGLALILLAWQNPPTIGDTVWITRSVSLPAGTLIRPRPLESGQVIEPLGPPQVVLRGQTAILRYPLVIWRPGHHRIDIPGPILVRSDGWSDTLAAVPTEIEVASVLPSGPSDSLAPRPAQAPVLQAGRSLLPVVALILLSVLLLAPVYWLWRRRGETVPEPVPRMDPPGPRLAAWLAWGEYRAVLDGWSDLLAAATDADGRDDLMARLGAARYAPIDAGLVDRLHHEAADWYRRHGGGAA